MLGGQCSAPTAQQVPFFLVSKQAPTWEDHRPPPTNQERALNLSIPIVSGLGELACVESNQAAGSTPACPPQGDTILLPMACVPSKACLYLISGVSTLATLGLYVVAAHAHRRHCCKSKLSTCSPIKSICLGRLVDAKLPDNATCMGAARVLTKPTMSEISEQTHDAGSGIWSFVPRSSKQVHRPVPTFEGVPQSCQLALSARRDN
jgi:hypothetical protein